MKDKKPLSTSKIKIKLKSLNCICFLKRSKFRFISRVFLIFQRQCICVDKTLICKCVLSYKKNYRRALNLQRKIGEGDNIENVEKKPTTYFFLFKHLVTPIFPSHLKEDILPIIKIAHFSINRF